MRRSLALALVVVFVLSLSVLPAAVAADTRVGGTVVVSEDETVGDVSATGGTVIVEGTVDGDLRAYGGTVVIAEGADVTGIVRVYGGDVRIDGAVGENALVYGGSVTLGESGTVDRSFGAVGGDVRIDGTVGGDVTAVAGSVTLGSTATVEGNLFHAGAFTDEGGVVDGVTQEASDLGLAPPIGPFAFLAGALLFVSNLLLGALLLWFGPRFADAAVETVVTEPLRTAGAGIVGVLAVAVGVVVLAVTILGIPLALALLAAGLVLAWIASVYGRYVVGAWLLSFTDVDNRYLALVIGVFGVGLVGLLPYVGPLVRAVVFLFGAGVVALGVRNAYELITSNRRGLADL